MPETATPGESVPSGGGGGDFFPEWPRVHHFDGTVTDLADGRRVVVYPGPAQDERTSTPNGDKLMPATTIDLPIEGVVAIARERAHQVGKGYTREHDASHGVGQLINAALAYTVQAQDRISEAAGEGVGADGPATYWPWDPASFSASDDELRSLAKAGALLAAAYDAALARLGSREPQ